ncbi:MAG: hypothetical protein AAGG59_14855 [Bacteroidota bacterium]
MPFEIIEVVGIVLVAVEIVLLISILRNKGPIQSKLRIFAFLGILVTPAVIMFTANYHVFETSKTVQACTNCHVMKPMGTDMLDVQSQTLAARHITNGWIKENQCYGCHKDYGLNGTLKAKIDGYRHLMRYVTETYKEPIVYRGEFDSKNCMSCHEGTPAFETLKVHMPVKINLAGESPSLSCMNCHGKAHPTRAQRTPGNKDYDRLMSGNVEFEVDTAQTREINLILEWLTNQE